MNKTNLMYITNATTNSNTTIEILTAIAIMLLELGVEVVLVDTICSNITPTTGVAVGTVDVSASI